MEEPPGIQNLPPLDVHGRERDSRQGSLKGRMTGRHRGSALVHSPSEEVTTSPDNVDD
jgi:hypothetical protein